jgi:hypothetical protein
MQRLPLLPGEKVRVPDPSHFLIEDGDSFLTLEERVRFERGVQKFMLKQARAGVPRDRLQKMVHKYRTESLRLRQVEARIKLELPGLGFGRYDWDFVRVLVRKLYALQRKYQCLTLARMWAYRATEATWEGLDKRAVRRLVYRCWSLMSGSNSLSDMRMLRQCMATYMNP